MPTRRILILDRNPGFAHILAQGLQRLPGYQVSSVHSGALAWQAVHDAIERQEAFHLLILDVSLTDMSPSDLVTQLRDQDPYLRVVLVPPFGQELSRDLAALDIQGVLPKPFFVHQLKAQVRSFFERPVVTAPPTRVERLQGRLSTIQPLLQHLADETSARLAGLICQGEWVAFIGAGSPDQQTLLAQLVREHLAVSRRLAVYLDEQNGRFDLLSCVGQEHSLYVLPLDDQVSLIVAPGGRVPLGVAHLHIKRAVEGLTPVLKSEPPGKERL